MGGCGGLCISVHPGGGGGGNNTVGGATYVALIGGCGASIDGYLPESGGGGIGEDPSPSGASQEDLETVLESLMLPLSSEESLIHLLCCPGALIPTNFAVFLTRL